MIYIIIKLISKTYKIFKALLKKKKKKHLKEYVKTIQKPGFQNKSASDECQIFGVLKSSEGTFYRGNYQATRVLKGLDYIPIP